MQLLSTIVVMLSAMMFGHLNAGEPTGPNGPNEWASPGPADWASPIDTSKRVIENEKMIYARNFEFDGHVYLLFISEDAKGMRQVIHDPDCPCFKSKKEEKK